VAWTEADHAEIRHYLGFAALFLQADSRLETAIGSVQSKADGGTREDNSTELQIRRWIAGLARIEQRLADIWEVAEGEKVEELGVDPYRGMALLRAEGRRLVGNIARVLSTSPRHDVFSAAEPNPHGSTFPEVDGGTYRW
jgi:hypothetical protein